MRCGSFAKMENAKRHATRGGDRANQSGDAKGPSETPHLRCWNVNGFRCAGRVATCQINSIFTKLLAEGGEVSRKVDVAVGGEGRIFVSDDFRIKRHGRGPRSENRGIVG